MVSASSCAVRMSIDAETAIQPPRTAGRLDRLVKGALAFDAQEPPTLPLLCVEDVRRDDAGSASYAPFFPANEIGPDGHLGGNVVYALDLGGHNEVLRARFGDRQWYRFGPPPPPPRGPAGPPPPPPPPPPPRPPPPPGPPPSSSFGSGNSSGLIIPRRTAHARS